MKLKLLFGVQFESHSRHNSHDFSSMGHNTFLLLYFFFNFDTTTTTTKIFDDEKQVELLFKPPSQPKM